MTEPTPRMKDVSLLLTKLRTNYFKAGRSSARSAVRKLLKTYNPCPTAEVNALQRALNQHYPTLSAMKTRETQSDPRVLQNMKVLVEQKHWPTESDAHKAVKNMKELLRPQAARVLHMAIRMRYSEVTTPVNPAPGHPLQASERVQELEEHIRLKMETQRYELVRMVAPMVVQAAGRRSAATKEKMYPAASLAKFSLAIVDNLLEGLYRKE